MSAKNSATESIFARPSQEALFDLRSDYEQIMDNFEYSMLDSPEMRERYVRHTEKLIATAIENKTTTMMFLDKSARPVAWLTRALWPMLGVDEDGKNVPMPDMRFANIDREQWEPIVGRTEDKDGGIINIDNVPVRTISQLSDTYKDLDSEEERILIVDEVMSSGDTNRIAGGLFRRAFPDADILTTYWMPPELRRLKGGGWINADTPIWYNSRDPHGRLVADRDIKISGMSTSSRQRMGAVFLSTRFDETDTRGVQLREEMYRLGDEVAAGVMPVTPSSQRSRKAIETIMSSVNNVSIPEWKTLKQASTRPGESFQQLFVEYKLARARSAHPTVAR